MPEVLQGCKSKEEYVERLAEGDAEMDRLREEAFKEGKVVRYVGVIDAQSGKVEAKLEKWVSHGKERAFADVRAGIRLIIPLRRRSRARITSSRSIRSGKSFELGPKRG